MQRFTIAKFIAVGALTVAACSGTQTPARTEAPNEHVPTIDEEVARLFTHPYPEGEVPYGAQFSPDGEHLVYSRTSGRGDHAVSELWILDVASNEARRFNPAPTLTFSAIAWLPDSQRLLASANGALYVVNIEGESEPQQIAASPASSPRLSPNGEQVAFLREHDIWIVDIAEGRERRITQNGSNIVLNGEVDWVYEEELELSQAFWWSPDGQHISYLQFDESPVTSYPIRYPGTPTPNIVQQRYPQAGEPNPIVRLGVIDLEGDTLAPRWLDLGLPEEEETYVARSGWIPSGEQVFVVTLDRLQRHLRLIFIDPTGAQEPRVVLEESDEQWLNLLDEPHFLADGEHFLWRSERDGHAHLYVHDIAGGEGRQLTSGSWQVAEVVDVDEEAGVVRFVGNRESPAVYQIESVPLEGGEVTRISTAPGCHSPTFSPDHSVFIDYHSSLSRPPRLDLFRANGEQIGTIAEEDLVELPDLDRVNVEIFDIPGPDDIQYQARMFRPAELEPERRYPVLIWVYNGPGAQIVRNQWRTKYVPWMRLLAQRGVIVFSMDGRGTHGRGRDWEKPIYRQLTEVELADQLRGVEYLRSLDFIDDQRIGVFGWSYGGTMVLSALLRHPGVFRVGVSVAPVSDWRFYDTIYTERYMMRPRDNPEGYQQSALWPIAENLSDPLLLIHGLSDDNVHFRNSERMAEALIDEGRRFDLMVYPGQAHGISAPSSRRHVFSTITSYLLEHLLD